MARSSPCCRHLHSRPGDPRVNFTAFTPENDPHQEHDVEALEHARHRIFLKIDYYDPALEGGSADPTDPEQTARVLTIMLASEY